MASSDSGANEHWLTLPSSKDSCSQQSCRGPATTPTSQGCLEAVLKLEWSSNWQGRFRELVTLSNLRKDVHIQNEGQRSALSACSRDRCSFEGSGGREEARSSLVKAAQPPSCRLMF